MSSKTSKKALKDLRRLTLDQSINFLPLQKFLTQKFRLDKLQLHLLIEPRIINMLQASINPDLKNLVVKTSIYTNWVSPTDTRAHLLRLLSYFKLLQHLSLYPSLLQSTPQNSLFLIPKLAKLKLLEWLQDGRTNCFPLFLLDPKISKYFTQLQDLSLLTPSWLPDHPLFSSLVPLHNLKAFSLTIPDSGPPSVDFTLLSKFQNLESFSLTVHSTVDLVINDFAFLTNLKRFSFRKTTLTTSLYSSIITPDSIENLPKLESLEIISYFASPYDLAFYKNLASKAPNIKALSIVLPSDSLNELFEEASLNFSLEKFSLRIQRLTAPFIALSKNLSAFLKENPHFKNLELYFSDCYASFLEPIMKCVKSLTRLETLKFGLRRPIELQDRKILLLKDVISKPEDLRLIHLEFPQHSFDSREVSGLVNSFMKLGRLERLALNTRFVKVSDESFGKFVEFVRNAKRIKSMKLRIKGCPEEKERELEKALGYDISYWGNPNMKISTIMNFGWVW